MFGYVLPNKNDLSPEQEKRYKAAYCGLCDALKQRHGALSRLMLNYDMAFLVLVLDSLYEPESIACERRCIMHPFCKKPHRSSEFTLYAADMTAALFYHKCMDDWYDERALTRLYLAKRLKKSYAAIAAKYPAQCQAMETSLAALRQLERAGARDPDASARCFGELLAAVFAPKENIYSVRLRAFGGTLGEFVYMMDAWDDAPRDAKRKRYNPLSTLYREADFDKRCQVILQSLMARCAEEFEKMPLGEDIALMRNVIYSGVWTKFELKMLKKKSIGKGERANGNDRSV